MRRILAALAGTLLACATGSISFRKENACPNFGRLAAQGDPAAFYQPVKVETHDGKWHRTNRSVATQSSGIQTKETLAAFLAEYETVCGKSHPPWFREIAIIGEAEREHRLALKKAQDGIVDADRRLSDAETRSKPAIEAQRELDGKIEKARAHSSCQEPSYSSARAGLPRKIRRADAANRKYRTAPLNDLGRIFVPIRF